MTDDVKKDESLEAKLEKLVGSIMDGASAENVKLGDRLEALKIVSNYYVNLKKLNRKAASGDSDDDTTTMAGLRERFAGDAEGKGDNE